MKFYVTGSVYCACLALVFTLFYPVLRSGFEFSFIPVIQSVGICFFLLNFPIQLRHFFLKNDKVFWQHPAFLTVISLLIVIFCTFLQTWLGIPFAWILTGLGFLLFAKTLYDFVRTHTILHQIGIISAGLVLGLWLMNVAWGQYGALPTWRESTVVGEKISKRGTLDIHYHTAFAQMLTVHQIPSTGLDGVIRMHYHYASHLLTGQFSNLLQVSVLEAYTLAYPIIILPFFFSLFLSFVFTLRNFISQYFKQDPKEPDFAFWVLLLMLFIGIPKGMYSLGIVGESFMAIQAYTLSLAFFFAFLTPLLHFWQNLEAHNRPSKIIFLLLVAPVLYGFVGFSSISTMMVLGGMTGYAFLRLKLFKNPIFCFGMAAMGLVFVFTYLNVVETNFSGQHYSSEGEVKPFYFYKFSHGFQFWDFITLLYLWLYIFTILYIFRNKTFRSAKDFFTHNQSFPVEMAWLTALLGVLPTFVLQLGASGGMYFAGVQIWVCGAFLLAFLPYFKFLEFSQKLVNQGISLIISAVIFLLLYIEVRNHVNTVFRDNMLTRRKILGLTSAEFSFTDILEKKLSGNDELKNKWDSLYSDLPQKKLAQNPKYRFLKILEEIDKLPLSEKKRSLLYVNPIKNDLDFDWVYCQEMPLMIVAYSGTAMLDGIPPLTCQFGAYGFEYHPHRLPDLQRNYTEKKLLEMARQKGFEKVIMYDPDKISYHIAEAESPPKR